MTAKRKQNRIIGTETFAAITAVEGLVLSRAATKRLAEANTEKLDPEQRRAKALKAYQIDE